MPWIGALASGVIGGLMGGGSSTGGAGAQMYVPTGLGYADTGWQQNQQANQNQLNYGGYGNPQSFMGGATDWGSLMGYGGGGGYPQGSGGYPMQGGQQQAPDIRMGGYGQQGGNMMQGGGGQNASIQQPGMPPGAQQGWYPTSDASAQNNQGSGVMQGGQGPGNTGFGPQTGQSGGQPSQNPYQGSGAGGGLAGITDPAAYQSYALSQGINYNPYLQASQQAGQQFGGLAQQAGQVGNSMYGEGNYALGTQGQLGQQGNQFLNQQQQLAGQSSQLGYGQLGQSQGIAGQQQGLGYGQLGQNQQLAGGLQQAGAQVYNTAADPQNALYNQQFQQATDQANAVNSMYGLGSSGAGAGIANQAQQNFNTNWENQQLARQQSGLSSMLGANQAASGILGSGYAGAQGGLSSATGTLGQGYGGAQTGLNSAGALGTQGISGLNSLQQTGAGYGSLGNASNQAGLAAYGQQPGYTQNAAQVPLNAQQYVAGQPAANATAYAGNVGQLMAPYDQQQNQAIPYMNYGSGAGANAYANTAKAGQLPAQQAGAIGTALGNSGINWSSVGNWFNPQGSGGYGQDQLTAQYGNTGYDTGGS